MYRTFPRLPTTAARQILATMDGKEIDDIRLMSATSHPAARLEVGVAISDRELGRFRDELRGEFLDEVLDSRKNGFGDNDFDRQLGALLLEKLPLTPYEAAHREVWNFLGLVVLPEVGFWRFPKLTHDRFFGPPLRNVLGRTWWRAHLLGPDLGSEEFSADPLGENELYALVEKTTIGLNTCLVVNVARAIYRYQSASSGRDAMVEELTKDLLRIVPWRDLNSLDEDEVDRLLDERVRIAAVRARLNPKGMRRKERV
jgi:hypothetical protein